MQRQARTGGPAIHAWFATALTLLAGCGDATGLGRYSLANEVRPVTASRLDGAPRSWGLVRLSLNGSAPVPLGPLRKRNLRPAVSPSGSRMAFVSETDTGGVFVSDFDGLNSRRVYASPWVERLSWSPDGTRLLATIDRFDSGTGSGELVVIQADGTGSEVITGSVNLDVGVATWSPDGSRIAMEVWITRFRSVLYVMTATGTGARLLFQEPGYSVRDPAWSRDGRLIALALQGSDSGTVGGASIFVIDSSGTNKRRVMDYSARWPWDLKPQWSPSGRWLAIERFNPECAPKPCLRWDVAVVRLDGSGLTLLSERDAWGAAYPAW